MRRSPLGALLVAVNEARLRRVVLAQVLKSLALADDFCGVRQVIFAESSRTCFATEKDTTYCRRLAAAFVARVMRARPPMVSRDILDCDPYAVWVHRDRTQVATHDFTSIPARLTH